MTKPIRYLGTALLIVLTGCHSANGVNVGANIPIGGVAGVSVNKTVGSDAHATCARKGQADDTGNEPTDEALGAVDTRMIC